MVDSIQDILAREDVNWKDIKVEDQSKYARLPDGTYHAVITDSKLTTSKAGSAMLVLELTIEDNKHKGKKHNVYNLLSGAGLTYSKQKIEMLGFKLEKLQDLIPVVQNGLFIGKTVQIKIATNGDNSNTYFQKVLDTILDGDEDVTELTEDDEVEGTPPW